MRDHQADPQAIMDAHAKSFSWAARFLSKDSRVQAAQLYAFARLMDDLVDEPAMGVIAARLAQFDENREQVLGFVGVTGRSHEVGKMLHALNIDKQVLRTFLDALKGDAPPRHLQSLQDVLGFAYGVAGTVGQMMRPILDASPQAERYAVALGMAMQLTNIARDVLEDAHRGRCYLPAQWLPPDWQVGKLIEGCTQTRSQAFAAIQRLLAEAEPLYALAEQGFAAIPMPNRRAVKIACVLYRGIGHKILKSNASTYWAKRVHLSFGEKTWVVLRILLNKQPISLQPSVDILRAHQHVLGRIPGFPPFWV